MQTYDDYWKQDYIQHYGKLGMRWGRRNAKTSIDIKTLKDKINKDSKNRIEINKDILRRKPAVEIKRDYYNAYIQEKLARSLGGRNPGTFTKARIRRSGKKLKRNSDIILKMNKTLNKNKKKMVYNQEFLKTIKARP